MGTRDRARFEAEQDKSGQWRFRLRAANGRIVGPTESWKGSPSKVRRAIEAMLRAADQARKHPVEIVTRHGRTRPMPWGRSRPRR